MKPSAFDYSAPSSKDGILRALAGAPPGTRILAGGQSIVPLMNARQMRPPVIVDINNAPDLGWITVEKGVLRIGALVRMSQAESSPEVRACCPLITEALRWVANPQVRNRATIVGNLVHAAKGSEMPAVAVALDAEFTVESAGGRSRTIPAHEFFRPTGGAACGPGDFVTAVSFPCQPPGCGSAFVEAQRRSSHYALLGAAAVLLIRSGTIHEARLSFAGAAPVPIRCFSAEQTLVGGHACPEILMKAAALAGNDGTTLAYEDLHATSDYRRMVAPELAARALFSAARSAGSNLQQPHWS